jgi:hypothetical protein
MRCSGLSGEYRAAIKVTIEMGSITYAAEYEEVKALFLSVFKL